MPLEHLHCDEPSSIFHRHRTEVPAVLSICKKLQEFTARKSIFPKT
ncbi:hypothetical protein HMPREF1546_04179 [Oscillibacter sp. KLE 1745]|nr:hypothetical protein HMPREF1546_04179 [Oscillibacter sp. KLE 1745]